MHADTLAGALVAAQLVVGGLAAGSRWHGCLARALQQAGSLFYPPPVGVRMTDFACQNRLDMVRICLTVLSLHGRSNRSPRILAWRAVTSAPQATASAVAPPEVWDL